ncbi:hypothetical protein MLD38_027689 [Melastoma candidum]|uniref:Uncharacterized protein n=1 Tax=Melastoma candidum TaxID=119954 RepID=A0ACB9P2C8_9MYRT|nr:hypothetical protein MLD38_027689 [Melastoma candidum]
MCQINNAKSLMRLDKFCAPMGPLDLSAGMGYLWDPANKKVRENVEESRGRGAGERPGLLVRDAAVEDVKRFKMGLGTETSSDDKENEREKDAEKYRSE